MTDPILELPEISEIDGVGYISIRTVAELSRAAACWVGRLMTVVSKSLNCQLHSLKNC
jgi:hypothetical protein